MWHQAFKTRSSTTKHHTTPLQHLLDSHQSCLSKPPLQQLFSSPVIADLHLTECKRDSDRATDTAPPGEAVVPVVADVQKILTEILLQCQYCNRTYSDKSVLMRHQSTHTTDKNYECKSCGAVFDSYVAAAQHWLRPCVETANVFYLARMICCEKCERTFKSHELLYIHKVKQKHFVPKIHVDKGSDDLVKVKEEPPSSDEEQASPPGEEVKSGLGCLKRRWADGLLICFVFFFLKGGLA